MRKLKRRRPRLPALVPYDRCKRYGEALLRRECWRIASFFDDDDIAQEAFAIFWRVCTAHPGKTEGDIFRIYKVAIWFRMNDISRSCFPNPYNKGEEGNPAVQIDTDMLEGLLGTIHSEADVYLETLAKIPVELHDAFVLLVREFLGLEDIPRKSCERLGGKQWTESLLGAVKRKAGLHKSRQLWKELILALDIGGSS